MPRRLCEPMYSQRDLDICENFKFILKTFCEVGLVCSGNEIVYIHTPKGYSFSWKLYRINVRNLSMPPRTWYFLNSQCHEVSELCQQWTKFSNNLFCLWCRVLSRISIPFSEEIFCCQGKTTKIVSSVYLIFLGVEIYKIVICDFLPSLSSIIKLFCLWIQFTFYLGVYWCEFIVSHRSHMMLLTQVKQYTCADFSQCW